MSINTNKPKLSESEALFEVIELVNKVFKDYENDYIKELEKKSFGKLFRKLHEYTNIEDLENENLVKDKKSLNKTLNEMKDEIPKYLFKKKESIYDKFKLIETNIDLGLIREAKHLIEKELSLNSCGEKPFLKAQLYELLFKCLNPIESKEIRFPKDTELIKMIIWKFKESYNSDIFETLKDINFSPLMDIIIAYKKLETDSFYRLQNKMAEIVENSDFQTFDSIVDNGVVNGFEIVNNYQKFNKFCISLLEFSDLFKVEKKNLLENERVGFSSRFKTYLNRFQDIKAFNNSFLPNLLTYYGLLNKEMVFTSILASDSDLQLETPKIQTNFSEELGIDIDNTASTYIVLKLIQKVLIIDKSEHNFSFAIINEVFETCKDLLREKVKIQLSSSHRVYVKTIYLLSGQILRKNTISDKLKTERTLIERTKEWKKDDFFKRILEFDKPVNDLEVSTIIKGVILKLRTFSTN